MLALADIEAIFEAPRVRGQSALRADSSTSALFSRTGSLRGGCIRAAFDHLPLVMDYPVGRVPDAPHPHLSLTMRTAQRVPPRALLIPLPVGQPGNDLNGALDHAFHLGHSLANQHLELGKCFRGFHAVIPDALEAFWPRALHHPAAKCCDFNGFKCQPLGSVGAVMVRHPVAIIAID